MFGNKADKTHAHPNPLGAKGFVYECGTAVQESADPFYPNYHGAIHRVDFNVAFAMLLAHLKLEMHVERKTHETWDFDENKMVVEYGYGDPTFHKV